MYFELALISVVIAGGYWAWHYLRRRPHGANLFGLLLGITALLAGLGLIGRSLDIGALAALGAVGIGGATRLLIVAPAIRTFARRLAASERFGLATRLLDVAEILAPGSGVAEEKALLGAMREIRDGKIEKTVDALTAAKTGAPAEARLAIDERIAMLYLAAYRWEEGIAYAETHLWPMIPTESAPAEPTVATPVALRRVLGLAPPVWVELVGAYGRAGDLDRAAGMLVRLEDACAGRADASVWIHRARLMFLALSGRVAAVEELTRPRFAQHIPAAARTYWRGVAHERHGETAAATAAYTKARGKARGKSRELVEQAIAKLPDAKVATLGARATEVIARIEAAPLPKVAVRSTPASEAKVLAGFIVIYALAVAYFVGDSTDPAVLLRAGAMARTQIHAGEWWRLFSCVFVHHGFMHMVLNVVGLVVIGRICEELFPRRMSAIFFISGIAGAVVSYALSAPLTAGASGGVMGLLGAAFIELTLHRGRYRALWKRGVWSAIAIVTLAEIGFGFMFPFVDQWAHGAGLVAGVLVGMLLSPHVRWARFGGHLAWVIALGGFLVCFGSALKVMATTTEDSFVDVPQAAWNLHGVTVFAPAAWAINDGELVDEDVFIVLALEEPTPSLGLDKDLSEWVASEPTRAAMRHFDQVTAATERVLPLPPGWTGSELEVSYEDPLGERVRYRCIVAAKEIGGHVVVASLYAPDSLAREHPAILSDLLATAH